MSTVAEIEAAVRQLSDQERAAFREWFERFERSVADHPAASAEVDALTPLGDELDRLVDRFPAPAEWANE